MEPQFNWEQFFVESIFAFTWRIDRQLRSLPRYQTLGYAEYHRILTKRVCLGLPPSYAVLLPKDPSQLPKSMIDLEKILTGKAPLMGTAPRMDDLKGPRDCNTCKVACKPTPEWQKLPIDLDHDSSSDDPSPTFIRNTESILMNIAPIVKAKPQKPKRVWKQKTQKKSKDENRPKTCYKCDSTSHMYSGCPIFQRNRLLKLAALRGKYCHDCVGGCIKCINDFKLLK